jgi:hypothetical protein
VTKKAIGQAMKKRTRSQRIAKTGFLAMVVLYLWVEENDNRHDDYSCLKMRRKEGVWSVECD